MTLDLQPTLATASVLGVFAFASGKHSPTYVDITRHSEIFLRYFCLQSSWAFRWLKCHFWFVASGFNANF